MKIGILTFHYSNNYGGVLQAMALYKVLKQRGVEVTIINYIPYEYNPNSIKNMIRTSWIGEDTKQNKFKKSIIKMKKVKKICRKMDDFRKEYMNIDRLEVIREEELEGILKKYECIIVGSDQVWNPYQRSRREYFLDYKLNKNIKRISYAVDSTNDKVDLKDKNDLLKKIEKFDKIMVRNMHTYRFVKKISKDKDVDIVADPTLIYDFDELKIEKNQNEEYIFMYVLGKEINEGHREALRKIKSLYGEIRIKAVQIPDMQFQYNTVADEIIYDANPKEWLELIANAKVVYTDSFHGTLFAIKYNKPFVVYYVDELRAPRFMDLKERYFINKNIIDKVEKIELMSEQDLIRYRKNIDNHKKFSLEKLKEYEGRIY